MDPRGPLLWRAPQRFAIKRHGDFARDEAGGVLTTTLSAHVPSSRFQIVAVHLPKDRVQRRGTGGVMGKTERMSDTGTIIASPFGEGAIAAVAT